MSWLLSNNRLEKVPVVSVPHNSSNRLLIRNQDKGCTPSVAHSLPLPLGPALLNLSSITHAFDNIVCQLTFSVVLNSGVTGGVGEAGGRVHPETSDREISANLPEKKGKEKGGGGSGEKKKENCKKEGGKL